MSDGFLSCLQLSLHAQATHASWVQSLLYLHVIQKEIWEIHINDICTCQLTEPRLQGQKEYLGENPTTKGTWTYPGAS